MGTLPWGWHEDGMTHHVWERCSILPVLPNVGEHDDLTLSHTEHDAMRDISARWKDEVPCENVGWVGEPDVTCPRPAAWVGTPECGHVTTECEQHKSIDDQGYAYVCECGHETTTAIRWRRL